MNTLIISTFSCKFEKFKHVVTTLFLEEMCKEFVSNYEIVKVNEHKSLLLMNCSDLEKLGKKMESPLQKNGIKKLVVRMKYIQSSLLHKLDFRY